MAMYAQLLAGALAAKAGVSHVGELVTLVRECRQDIVDLQRRNVPEQDLLAAEIRYDRALLWLCGSVGIETSAGSFSPPGPERRRLEHELAMRGVGLSDTPGPSSFVWTRSAFDEGPRVSTNGQRRSR